VLYEMLTGRVPFRADTPVGTVLQQLHDPPRPPRELRPDLREPLAAVVLRALEKDPTRRFASADDMGRARGSVAATVAAPVAPKASRPVPAARSRTPTRLLTPVEIVRSPSRGLRFGRHGLLVLALGVVAVTIAGMMLAVSRGGRVVRPPAAPQMGETAGRDVAPPSGEAAAAAEPAGRDGEIHNEVQRLLFGSTALRDARIAIEVANGIVTLSGDVPTATAGDLAVSLARSVSGVRQVFSTLRAPGRAAAALTPPAGTPPAEAPPDNAARPDDGRERVRELLDQARTAMQARNGPAAQEAFEAVLRLEPDNAIARIGLERLRQGLPGGAPGAPPPRQEN
jgi:hypothetical protein